VSVVDSSFSPLQELTVKLKIMERMIIICLTMFPNSWLLGNYLYHKSFCFTTNRGFTCCNL